MLGGIFIKAEDPKYLARWYEDNLGIGFGANIYFSFKWREKNNSDKSSITVFSFFKNDTDYFYPGNADSMLNIRVENLDDLRIRLQREGVKVDDKIESYEYGRFSWIFDPDGNKIELWEPLDKGFGEDDNKMELLGNVTGIGGVFLKCSDVKKTIEWYSKHLGFDFTYSFTKFEWRDLYKPNEIGATTLSFFPETTDYFGKSTKDFMINFRVKNLAKLLDEFRASGVETDGKMETYEYGKFGWIYDPEGNRIELWEP